MDLTFVLVSLLLLFVQAKVSQKEISINGDNWSLSESTGKVKNVKATVPGIVHLDLYANKIIEDPYYGENDLKYQWIAYSDWMYQTHFTLSDFGNQHVFMKCDGVDTIATFILNGHEIGIVNNYFRRWIFDITNFVKVGTNSLAVNIESAANYSIKKSNQYPYEIPARSNYIQNTARNFIRKAPSDFGWDWGPAFVPCGIWQNISIVIANSIYITDIALKVHYNKTDATYSVEGLVCYTQLDKGNYQLMVMIEVPNTPFSAPYTKTIYTSTIDIKKCERITTYSVKANQLDNYLWKPYSSTNPKPLLYEAIIKVSVSQDKKELFDISKVKKIGFRNIVIVQEPPPSGEKGLLFYFQQSDSKGDYPIYVKGSNFITMDAFVTRATPDTARRLLSSAIAINQNIIRIWGIFHPDWFYDICDELGLLVWQELMFSNAFYPRNTVRYNEKNFKYILKEFLENIHEEITDNVRRLGHHPSIVLWSGNNEIQNMALKSTVSIIDYSLLYDRNVRVILWKELEDMTRSYWPSSPSNGAIIDDPGMGLYIQRWGDAQDTSYGDIHRYDYYSLCNDVTTFPCPRFATEFGFQSYPSFYSLSKISSKEDWSNDSPFFNHRQHHPNGNKEMENMIAKFFNLPNKTDTVENFKNFIYLSQVVQVICVGSEAEHYRRLLSEEGAYTRGTLYWQLNDNWQAQTWSSIEYGGRWKLLHYAMKRIYSEVLLSIFAQKDSIYFYVTVDQPQLYIKYSLEVDVFTWEGKHVHNEIVNNLQSNGFTGKQVAQYKISDILKGTTPNDCYLYAWITEDGFNKVLSSTYFFPGNISEAKLPIANISISDVRSTNDNSVSFRIRSNATAVYVMLDSGSLEGYFNDNGFLMSGMTDYNMTFTSWSKFDVQEFNNSVDIRSIIDTYVT